MSLARKNSVPLERTAKRVLMPVTTPRVRRLLIDARNYGAGRVASVRATSRPGRMKPSFLIVGAQKAGTTFLYLELLRHPAVVPALTKEVQYFSDHFSRGPSWYSGFFASASAASRRPVLSGEATPEYMFHPRGAARIAAELPDVRIIVLLRDPVSRTFSQYQHERRLGYEPVPSFEEALAREDERTCGELERLLDDPDYVSYPLWHYGYRARGRYREQLEEIHQHIDADRVLILFAEDLYRSPCRTVGRVVDFLGLEPWSPQKPGRNDMAAGSSTMPPTAHEELRRYFAPHNRELSAYLGRDLPWPT